MYVHVSRCTIDVLGLGKLNPTSRNWGTAIVIICRGMYAEKRIVLRVATNGRSKSVKSVRQRLLQKITRPKAGTTGCEGWWSEMRAGNEAVANGQCTFQSYVTSLLKTVFYSLVLTLCSIHLHNCIDVLCNTCLHVWYVHTNTLQTQMFSIASCVVFRFTLFLDSKLIKTMGGCGHPKIPCPGWSLYPLQYF